MGYILIAKMVNTGKETLYRIIDNKTLEKADVTEKKLLLAQAEYLNFRKSTNGKKIVGSPNLYKPTIIINNKVEEEYKTLVSIDTDKDEVVLIDYTGKKEIVTIGVYLEARKERINNEMVLSFTDYKYIPLERYGGKAGERLELQIDKIEAINSIETKQIEVNDCTQPMKEETPEIKEEAIQLEKSDHNFKDIVFNMFPTDRITIALDDYSRFENVIIRILDSNMSNTLTYTLSKLYKSEDRTKYTLAFIKTDLEAGTVNIQVIGHSDIDGKLIKDDIEKICQTYAVWLKEAKFTKI